MRVQFQRRMSICTCVILFISQAISIFFYFILFHVPFGKGDIDCDEKPFLFPWPSKRKGGKMGASKTKSGVT